MKWFNTSRHFTNVIRSHQDVVNFIMQQSLQQHQNPYQSFDKGV